MINLESQFDNYYYIVCIIIIIEKYKSNLFRDIILDIVCDLCLFF